MDMETIQWAAVCGIVAVTVMSMSNSYQLNKSIKESKQEIKDYTRELLEKNGKVS